MSRHKKHKKEFKEKRKESKKTVKHVKKEHEHKIKKESKVSYEKPKKNNMNKSTITAVVIIAVLVLLAFLAYKFHPASSPSSKNKVNVDLYVMSFCPYGTQAEEGIIPAVKELGGVNLNLHFIASKNKTSGKFSSLHGPNEVQEDLRQVCIMKYYPNKWEDYVGCMASDYSSLVQKTEERWQECAKKSGINVNKIKSCSEGEEGNNLLTENIKDANSKNIGASPTVIIDGTPYSGPRDKLSFMRGVCSLADNKLPTCKNLPPPVKVLMTVLNDKRCGSDCDTTNLEKSLKQLIPGATVKEVDYSTSEGKTLYTGFGLKYLPAVIFNASIKDSSAYPMLKRYLRNLSNNNYLLLIKASFDPTREICDNGKDDNGNGLVDCADPDCKNSAVCKYNFTNNHPTLQLFVMSYCPFGTQAMKALLPVWSEFKAENAPADIELRFVSYTMHGDKEKAENKRLICIRNEQPDKLIPYLKCYLNASDGIGCLNKTGVDVAKMNKCIDTKYTEYFAVDQQLNKDYGVQGSPTFVLNGKEIKVGRSPEAIKEAICALYDMDKRPAVCSEKFSTTQESPGFGYQTGNSGSSSAQCS